MRKRSKTAIVLDSTNHLWRYTMKTSKIFAVLAILGLLAACAQPNPHPMDMTQLVQNAKTHDDHEALAKHYEDTAKEMQAKVDEHKKLLAQYEAKSYLYGRQAQAFKNHCQYLISTYQQAVTANIDMACYISV
jgi:hypothetical protein